MSDIKCNCPGNPNSHAKDCPVYMQEEITRLQAENEALKAANRDLQDWFDDARTTAEKAQARVAELEAVLGIAWSNHCLEAQEWPQLADALLRGASSEDFILRKQAEAVEAAVYELTPGHYGPPDDPSPEFNAACEMCAEFSGYAQRLRQQADEVENHCSGLPCESRKKTLRVITLLAGTVPINSLSLALRKVKPLKRRLLCWASPAEGGGGQSALTAPTNCTYLNSNSNT